MSRWRILLFGGLIVACEAALRTHRVTYSTESPLRITANFPFSEVECVRIDFTDIRRRQDNLTRTVWKARCPDDSNCLTAIRYGDPELHVLTEPEPLKPTGGSSACYSCFLRGTAGTGYVSFSVDEESHFDHCNLQLP